VDSGSNGTEQHSTKPGAKPTSERWSSSRLSDHVPLFQTVFFFFFFGVGKISYLAPVSTLVVLNCLQIGMTQRCKLAKKKFL